MLCDPGIATQFIKTRDGGLYMASTWLPSWLILKVAVDLVLYTEDEYMVFSHLKTGKRAEYRIEQRPVSQNTSTLFYSKNCQ